MISWHSKEYGSHIGESILSVGGVDVITCENCGLSHIVPLPSSLELQKFYEEEFYQSEKTDYINSSQVDIEWHKVGFGARLNYALELLGPKSEMSVLDIGCGPGSFLGVAKEQGWTVKGIEPSEDAVAHARSLGLDVDRGFFTKETDFGGRTFDFIHMSEVLEHVASPHELLESAIKHLNPDGVITVSVPNDFNPFQKAIINQGNLKEWWVVPGHHLNYFSFDSLEILLKKCGFDIVNRTTNFPMELFLLMGEDYTKDPVLGKKCHNRRKLMDINLSKFNPNAYSAFYASLAAADLGRIAIITGKTNNTKQNASFHEK